MTSLYLLGHLYLLWLALVTIAFIYNVSTIILRTAFTIYYTESNYIYWLILDYTCDVIYLLDMTVVKPRVQFIQNGMLQVGYDIKRVSFVPITHNGRMGKSLVENQVALVGPDAVNVGIVRDCVATIEPESIEFTSM